ncbi:hypothetical protein SeMB42_g07292 [Synchytrium endobioticum]|uniref:Uncharacterized protein n=1 Tax=Synchytrium endobioticum TaxID=286115 RepID=A0A507C0K7_9FUNG|nr:hypothetical protein SeMB42_g07292 [Synchytrium endobioticum]
MSGEGTREQRKRGRLAMYGQVFVAIALTLQYAQVPSRKEQIRAGGRDVGAGERAFADGGGGGGGIVVVVVDVGLDGHHIAAPLSPRLFNVGNVLHSLGRYEKAIAAWERSLNLDPRRPDAHVNIANCHALVFKDFPQPIRHLEKAAQLDPADGEIRFNLGAILDAAGMLEPAIQEYALAESSNSTKS